VTGPKAEPRILLSALGTRGDFHPTLAMATQLRNLGYDPVIATHIEYAEDCHKQNIPFVRLYPDLVQLEGKWSRLSERDSIQFIIGELLLPSIEKNFQTLCGQSFDLLVNHPLVFAGPIAAEKLQKKWISLALTPFGLFSAYDPPVIPQLPFFKNPGTNRSWFYRPLMALADLSFHSLAKPIQNLRLKVGLQKAKKNPLSRGQFSEYGTWGIFSLLLSPPRKDWPPNIRVLGFTRWQSQYKTGSKDFHLSHCPLIVGLGSMWPLLTESELVLLLQDVRKFKMKTLIVAGARFEDFRRLRAEDAFITLAKEVNYSDVLIGAEIFINSGGIGAIAEGLYHGVPQIILPLANDQFDNARRLEKLGYGIRAERHSLGRHDWTLKSKVWEVLKMKSQNAQSFLQNQEDMNLNLAVAIGNLDLKK